jgi:hypothetical protein
MVKISKSTEQYCRVLRWYQKLKAIDQGTEHDLPSEYYMDDVYAFFTNCFHLRDWMIHDSDLEIENKEKKLKLFIDGSEHMRICHDLCVGLKHLIITKPKVDSGTKVVKRRYELSLGENSPIFKAKYFVTSNERFYDTFLIATECIKEWKNFIKINVDESIKKNMGLDEENIRTVMNKQNF